MRKKGNSVLCETCFNLEGIMLCEISQRKTSTMCVREISQRKTSTMCVRETSQRKTNTTWYH